MKGDEKSRRRKVNLWLENKGDTQIRRYTECQSSLLSFQYHASRPPSPLFSIGIAIAALTRLGWLDGKFPIKIPLEGLRRKGQQMECFRRAQASPHLIGFLLAAGKRRCPPLFEQRPVSGSSSDSRGTVVQGTAARNRVAPAIGRRADMFFDRVS